MSIIYKASPQQLHKCLPPGQAFSFSLQERLRNHHIMPGDVWECDDCGKTYVCTSDITQSGTMIAMCPSWKRESRYAKWRRERKSTTQEQRGPDWIQVN